MNNETMLINAAKAMGAKSPKICKVAEICGIAEYVYDDIAFIGGWNPLESSADCAEMEDALDMGITRVFLGVESYAPYIKDGGHYFIKHVEGYKDHANKGAARRYATTMVAALIGEKL